MMTLKVLTKALRKRNVFRAVRNNSWKLLLFTVTLLIVGYMFDVQHESGSNFLQLETFFDDKKDWHDYEFMDYENGRVGPGEKGAPIILSDLKEIEENEKGYQKEGIYTIVNNKISSQRSLPDIRLEVCKARKYLKRLPKTSVIVIFYNENWNLLVRCMHSIWNRTPKSLLHEIILVSDKSTDENLNEPLQKYIKEHFSSKVKLFVNSERKGLIVTRMEGARKATGEVIVFLDSHMEVNVNWLPPLIEQIALNRTTAAVPIIDSFSPYTLEYQTLGHGSRGSFDWTLTYQWLPMRPRYQKKLGDVYQLSAMTGGAYAINRKYFFKLGGYDEGMMVWNGENYELSFKLHLCGGNLVQVPCSRVAHTTKHRTEYREQDYNVDFSSRNLKRLAEVWMDEFKEALYRTDPEKYNLDPGDLTKAFQLKKQLNCKPFKYYLDVIAPDLVAMYPPYEKPNFAHGAIYSEMHPKKCITFVGPNRLSPLKLQACSTNLEKPKSEQHFEFTWYKFIKYFAFTEHMCLDAVEVNMHRCHFEFGNQYWKWDLKTHQLINPPKDACVTSDVLGENLFMSPCNDSDFYQKFNWGHVCDVKALANWEKEGRPEKPYPLNNSLSMDLRFHFLKLERRNMNDKSHSSQN